MIEISYVNDNHRNDLPDDYHDQDWKEKLHYERSDVPAITHLDFSARLQTVHRETNPRYWKLINAFKSRTGCGMVVNTSFNVRGEPIVRSPDNAYVCFMRTDMDVLVMNDFVFRKAEQPEWHEDHGEWREHIDLD